MGLWRVRQRSAKLADFSLAYGQKRLVNGAGYTTELRHEAEID